MYININYIYNLYVFVYYIEYILILCICCIYYGNINIKHKTYEIYNIVEEDDGKQLYLILKVSYPRTNNQPSRDCHLFESCLHMEHHGDHKWPFIC